MSLSSLGCRRTRVQEERASWCLALRHWNFHKVNLNLKASKCNRKNLDSHTDQLYHWGKLLSDYRLSSLIYKMGLTFRIVVKIRKCPFCCHIILAQQIAATINRIFQFMAQTTTRSYRTLTEPKWRAQTSQYYPSALLEWGKASATWCNNFTPKKKIKLASIVTQK